MSIVSCQLMGGLGNYLFQISTSYSISIRDNRDLLIDTSNNIAPHKSYEFYTDNILRKIKFTDTINNYEKFVETQFNYKDIPKFNGNVKLIGYFQSEKYFYNYRSQILQLLDFDTNTKTKVLKKYSCLLESPNCSLHVRRGDYLHLEKYHAKQEIEYYRNSVELIGKDKKYFIFSDDIDWCKNNFNFIGDKIFVENNLDYEDLFLMTLCENNIIANSTFSWWGAWLNKNTEKIVIAPKKWFGINNSHLDTSDLYCNDWKII